MLPYKSECQILLDYQLDVSKNTHLMRIMSTILQTYSRTKFSLEDVRSVVI